MSEGNDRQLWVAAVGETPSYAKITPQREMTKTDNRDEQNAGHKNSGGVNLSISTQRNISISLDFVAEWPDAGAELVYAAYKENTPIQVQQRAGATGVVFECLMSVFSFSASDPYNGVSAGSLTLRPAAPPTIDLLIPA